MLLPNLIKDIFLAVKTKGTWNLYARKIDEKLLHIGTFYDDFHAIKCRRLMALLYGFGQNHLSKDDCMRDIPPRETFLLSKAHKLNLKSRNKMVAQHAQFVSELSAAVLPWNPAEKAAEILRGLK